MRWIYLSPHLDDAVLSAGGFIFDQFRAGNPVEIWNIFSGIPTTGDLTPLAKILHAQWGTETVDETVRLRREEDAIATSIIGAKTVHFDLPDCIYRRGADGKPYYTDLFVEPHAAEGNLPDQIARKIEKRLRPEDEILCQLGIGSHVDHVLVRHAAERLERRLWYAADVPYLFNQPTELDTKTGKMQADLHPITEAGQKSWVEAILAYDSQLDSLFESPEQLENDILAYYRQWQGFPLWRHN